MSTIGRYTNRSSSKEKRKLLRRRMTKAEYLLWNKLRASQYFGHKFRRQYSIGSYIVDFYCHKKKLVVEVDGAIHGEACNKKGDRIRTQYLEEQGYTVVRYTNDQITHNIDGVLEDLKQYFISEIDPL